MPQKSIEKSFCTTREAATLLGVSVGTVQLWVESGLLDAWKTSGGHRRVVRESIEKLLHHPSPRAAAPVPAAPLPAATDAGKQLSVVVVEDDPGLLRLYQAKLARWPMQPALLALDNGFAGLMSLGHSKPDLLILDLNMPGIDGFGMLKVLHHTPDMAGTHIVVVTGLDKAAVQERGGVPDGIEVLPKPIPFDRLQQIAQALADRKAAPAH